MMLNMNPGHYRRSQINSLPLNYQYAETSGTSMQSTNRLLSFDGLPRTQNAQQSMITPSIASSIPSHSYSLTTPMAMPQASTVWSDQNHTPMTFDAGQNTNEYYGYSPSITGNEHDSSPFLRNMNYSDVPRTCFPCDPSMLHGAGSIGVDSFDSSTYMIDADKNEMQNSPDRASLGYDALENPNNFSRLSISHSPKLEHEASSSNHFSFNKPTPFALPSSEPSENGGISSREMTVVDGDDPSVDEPYAKLIFKALMSKPDHSMVLQDIYQWFRDHTVKGASDTKGWMNSIRHNLSMNAVRKLMPQMVTQKSKS